MPILPENRARYPKDWRAIRERILLRSGGMCEAECVDGERCAAPNGARIVRLIGNPEDWRYPDYAASRVWETGSLYSKSIRVVLTIAHLDHTPENNDPENLRAYCQLHHNRHDAKHRAETRRRRKAASEARNAHP